MFKVGYKVVCVSDKSHYKDLELNKIYTISDIHKNKNTIQLYNMSNVYYSYRFLPLHKFRKKKIDKICSKLEMK
jgi:hypothetical protein